jgi:hypothetical protein
MNTINETIKPNVTPNLDALCQEFNGNSFYGLEYILDEYFQETTTHPSVPAPPSIDWFGLYG